MLLKIVLLTCSLCVVGFGQASYPSSLASTTTLLQANNNAQTTLTSSISSGTTTLPVASGSTFILFPTAVSIDQEIIKVCSATAFTLVVCSSGRGWDGTSAAAHNISVTVRANIIDYHHNQVAAEVIAIETFLGVNGAGIPSLSIIPSLILSALPGTCTVGAVRFVTNATLSTGGYYLYFCTATNTWTQFGYVAGGTGALISSCSAIPCTIDINTAYLPRLGFSNVYTGANDFSGASKTAPFRIGTADPGTCDATTREFFFNSTSNLLKSCNTANSWTAISGGSGATVTTSGQGYLCLFSCMAAPANGGTFTPLQARYSQFVLHDTQKMSKLGTYIATADTTSTASCGGAACGFAAAIYDSTCTKVAGSDLTSSQTMTAVAQLYSFATPVTLSPGVYQLGYTTDSTTVAFYATDSSTILFNVLNLQGNSLARHFTGATAATGHNSGLTMPASCGALTSLNIAPEYFVLFP